MTKDEANRNPIVTFSNVISTGILREEVSPRLDSVSISTSHQKLRVNARKTGSCNTLGISCESPA
jgi:hypothetical protein